MELLRDVRKEVCGTGIEGNVHKFYKYLYWDENIPEKKRNRIKWRLKVSKRDKPCYVLTLCEGRDQLEIYHCAFLQQKYYKKHPPYIIGVAKKYEEALDIVVEITKAALERNGYPDLKKYLFPEGD